MNFIPRSIGVLLLGLGGVALAMLLAAQVPPASCDSAAVDPRAPSENHNPVSEFQSASGLRPAEPSDEGQANALAATTEQVAADATTDGAIADALPVTWTITPTESANRLATYADIVPANLNEADVEPIALPADDDLAQGPGPSEVMRMMEQLTPLLKARSDAAKAATAPPTSGPAVGASPLPDGSPEIPRPAAGRTPKTEITRSPVEGEDSLSIHIQDTDIREVLELLAEQGGLNILASNSVTGRVSAALNGVDVGAALDAILRSTGFVAKREGKFIFVGLPADFNSMEQAIDHISTRVYRLNYIKAADLAALITPLLTPESGNVTVTSPSDVGIAADNTAAGADNFAGSDAVLVRDYEAVLLQVDQLVAEMDRRPVQVGIEAMILSVELSDNFNFGVDFQLLREQNHIRAGTGSPLGNLGQVSFADGGLKFGFLDSSLGTFINALETIGDTTVIATPRLMCLNKHRAEILIGQKLGYVNTTVTQTFSTQTVQFLEVGTQLRLRPFVSSDGLIRMEVHPELSTGVVKVNQGFTIPEKKVTEVTTNVMVRDGCTVIIGGLMQDGQTKNVAQLPVLGNTPGIGWLFRNKRETKTRSEIIVLVTPHIVCDDEAAVDGERAAGEYHRRHAVYGDHMSPLATRYLGRKYFRLAQRAWAEKDRNKSLRYVDLAIHFDPLNRAAIDLQSDIRGGRHDGDHNLPPGPDAAPQINPLGVEPVPVWILDDLEEGPGGVDLSSIKERSNGKPTPTPHIAKANVRPQAAHASPTKSFPSKPKVKVAPGTSAPSRQTPPELDNAPEPPVKQASKAAKIKTSAGPMLANRLKSERLGATR